jgi:hypothetical protein
VRLIRQWQKKKPHLALYLARQAFEKFLYALYLVHSKRFVLYEAQVRG